MYRKELGGDGKTRHILSFTDDQWERFVVNYQDCLGNIKNSSDLMIILTDVGRVFNSIHDVARQGFPNEISQHKGDHE